MNASPTTAHTALSMPGSVARPRSLMAFDYGVRRVGIAVGNTLTRSATPLCAIHAKGVERFTAISQMIAQWQPDALIVGVPLHPDGAVHDNTRRARRFARQLNGRFRLVVHEVDERYSTTEAQAFGAENVDAVSAAIILEQFLHSIGEARRAYSE